MSLSSIQITAQDQHSFHAHIAGYPQSPAALVILQEIFGVTSHIRSVAERYALNGFYTVTPALFDRVKREVEIEYGPGGIEAARAIASQLKQEEVLLDIAAAIAHARSQVSSGKVGVVGYCLGGTYAWLSATRLAPDAAVGYYGSKIPQLSSEKPNCPALLHFGRQDKGIPLSEVEKIQLAQPEVPVYLYDAGHGFNRDGSAGYSEPAATLARARTLDFLRKSLWV